MAINLPIVGDSDGIWGTILNESLTELDSRVVANTTAVGGFDSRIAGLESDITSLESHVTNLDGNVTTLTGQVSSLSGQVGTLTGQVSSLNSRVTTLENAGGGLIVGTTASLPAVKIGQMTLATDTGYLSYGASISGVATRVPWPGSVVTKLRNNGTQNMASGSHTALNWSSTVWDRVNGWSSGQPTRWTCTIPGVYQFDGAASWAASDIGFRRASLWLNDVDLNAGAASMYPVGAAGASTLPLRPMVLSMSVGQWVEVRCYHSSGSAGTLLAVGSNTAAPSMNVVFLGYYQSAVPAEASTTTAD